MQIQSMIACIVIMVIPPGFPVVPQPLDMLHGFGALGVYLIQKPQVRFFTVMLAGNIHLEGLVEQILFGCHDIGHIP